MYVVLTKSSPGPRTNLKKAYTTPAGFEITNQIRGHPAKNKLKLLARTINCESLLYVQVSIVSTYLQSVRAVIKSEKRDLSVDGFINHITLSELGNMNGDKFEQYFTSGQRHLFCVYANILRG